MSDRGLGDVDPVVPSGGTGRATDVDTVLTPDVEPAVPAGQVFTPPTGSTGDAGGSGDSGGKATEAKEQAKQQASQAAGQAKEVAHTAKEQTQQVAATATESAREVAHEATQQLSQVASEATTQARQLVDQATGELRSQASAQTERAAGGLHTLASQLEALASGRTEEAGPFADYARQLNGKVEELATRLEQRGPEGVLDDVQRFARRRPGAFLAGAALAGFVASRFFRGNQAAQDQGGQQGYQGGYTAGYDTGYRSDIDLRAGDRAYAEPGYADVGGEAQLGAPVAPLAADVEARRQYGSL